MHLLPQNCVLPVKCPHVGCHEAKLLHLHLKTCAAGSGSFDCPTTHHGCQQARKLLAHYKRCRTIRSRQMSQLGGSRTAGSSQHNCLVCTLVARQARTILDRGSSSPAKASVGRSPTTGRPIVSSFILNDKNDPVFYGTMLPPPSRKSLSPPEKDRTTARGTFSMAPPQVKVEQQVPFFKQRRGIADVRPAPAAPVAKEVPQAPSWSSRERSASCVEAPSQPKVVMVSRTRSASSAAEMGTIAEEPLDAGGVEPESFDPADLEPIDIRAPTSHFF